MVNEQINQGEILHTTPWNKNKEKLKFKRKKEGGIIVFLVCFFFDLKRGEELLFFLTKHPP